MEKRNDALDAWKGIATIAVVGIHSSGGEPDDSLNQLVVLVYRALLNFAVPFFFAISGYLAPDAEKIQKSGLLGYYKKRIVRLWIPYLLWTGITLTLFNPSIYGQPLSLLKAVITGSGIGIGYFVIVLTSLMLIHPFVVKFRKLSPFSISVIVTSISLVLLYIGKITAPTQPIFRFPYSVLFFPIWMACYYFGYNLKNKAIFVNRSWLLIALALLALSFIESICLWKTGNWSLASSQVRFFSYFYSASIVVMAVQNLIPALARWKSLVWLGQYSYVIYLTHPIFLRLGRSFLSAILSDITYLPLSIPILLLFALGVNCCFIYISAVFLPNYLKPAILGLRK